MSSVIESVEFLKSIRALENRWCGDCKSHIGRPFPKRIIGQLSGCWHRAERCNIAIQQFNQVHRISLKPKSRPVNGGPKRRTQHCRMETQWNVTEFSWNWKWCASLSLRWILKVRWAFFPFDWNESKSKWTEWKPDRSRFLFSLSSPFPNEFADP